MKAPVPSLSRRNLLAVAAAAPASLALPAILRSRPAQAATDTNTSRQAAVLRRQIGSIEVLALADGFGPIPAEVLVGMEAAPARAAAALAHKPFDPESITICINAYLVRTADRLIAVDAGAPGSMAPTLGAWGDSLARAGIAAEDIDSLFLTHMHSDHVGGIAGPDGSPLLANAQLVAAEAEWSFTHDGAVLASIPDAFKGMFMFSRGQLAPYADGRRMLPMDRETEIAPGVTAVPLPGHTPGHMGLRVESDGEALLIWGDIVHAPAYQFSHPDWSVMFDADMQSAIETRRRMFDMVSADDLLVAGMHLDFPAFGYVERRGEGYRYLAAPPDLRA